MPSKNVRRLKNRRIKLQVGVYPEEKEALRVALKGVTKDRLLALLADAYDTLKPPQRRDVLGAYLDKLRLAIHGGSGLLKEIEAFKKASLCGDYYAPFNINSKNFMEIPAETEEWFDRLSDLLKASVALVGKKEYAVAASAFATLFDLIDRLGDEEIVFADELGPWMIPVRMNTVAEAYIKALAKTQDGAGFARSVIELLGRDQAVSFSMKVYPAAKKVASASQKVALDKSIRAGKVKTR